VAALRVFAVAVALLAATPAAADPLDRWRVDIAEASARFGVPVAWIERVMRAESGGQTMLGGRPITSHAGAMGLMQLMPATWTAMRAAHGLGRNAHDPRDNILAGTAYLRAMYDRFGYPGLFGAYNAGPGRYAAHLASGRALPAETRAYLAQVSGTPSSPPQSLPQQPLPALFVMLRTSNASVNPSPSRVPDAPPARLFAIRAPR
jgi:soluble lytic murein transglycosylase-like protein